jgi:hypothetical protein
VPALGKPVLVLKAGEAYTALVTFAPKATGSFTGSLDVTSDDPKRGTLTIPLRGSGVSTLDPVLRVTPADLTFGNVPVGESKDLSVTISNASGGSPLVIESITSSNVQFVLAPQPAVPLAVDAGFEAEMSVRFRPDSAGAKSGTLRIVPAGGLSSATVTLNGTGTISSSSPKIEVSPASSIAFGEVTIGQTKSATVTLRNTGAAALTVSSIMSSNPRFILAANAPSMPLQVAVGGSISLDVVFRPVSAGQMESGTLTIASNDTSRPAVTLALTGTGVSTPVSPNPQISLTPASLDFGTVAIGQTKDLSLTIRNSGAGTLEVTAAAFGGGSGAASFRMAPDFPAPLRLAAGASQTLTVRFAPSAAGDFRADLTFASNDLTTPSVAVALRGAGQASQPGSVSISVTPASLDFGGLMVGQTRDLSFAIRGTGTTPLTVMSIASSVGAGLTIVSPPAFPVSTGLVDTIQVAVRFAPTAAGALTAATLTIRSNASNQGALVIPVTGTAYAPGNVELRVDDGTFERTMSVPGMYATVYYLNRLTPPAYPATIRTVRIYFSDKADALEPRTPITVLAGSNESGAANITHVALSSKLSATVPTTLGRFVDFTLTTPITIQSGDFVAGFSAVNSADTSFTVAVDAGPPFAKRSYTSTDGVTFQLQETANRETNLGIRIIVALGGGTP